MTPTIRRALSISGASLLSLALASPAAADQVDKIGSQIIGLEAEVGQIGKSVRTPQTLATRKDDVSSRRLVNAQVALGMGNYDDAAIMLYDIVEKGGGNRAYEEALFYLGEALYQKEDYIGARKYFRKTVDELGSASPFYQQSLQRLVELSLENEDEDVAEYLAALDRIPESQREPSVPYVRGRYLFFNEQYDAALASFAKVPPQSEYYMRSQYFIGATHIARNDLAAAAEVFQELTRREATTPADRRVAELSHMALGRLHYERDQPSKAIDQYLMISRKSDLFDEALYEVAWVYVKDQKFERALRALELLALSDPESARLPDVRILEGNLRIRRAQSMSDDDAVFANEEFDKAMAVFEGTQQTFSHAHSELERIIAEQADPKQFVRQITQRTDTALDVEHSLPPVAVAWLREQPEVQRVVAVDEDLDTIRRDIQESATTIRRLEAAINSPSAVNVFPELADKRARLVEIFEQLQAQRVDLAQRQWQLAQAVASDAQRAQYARLQSDRRAIERELSELPNAELAFSERVEQARAEYGELDKRAQELSVLIDSTEATLVAVEKYLADQDPKNLSDAQKQEFRTMIDQLRADVETMRNELVEVRHDITLARDQAGVSDRTAERAAVLRREYAAASDAERAFLAGVIGQLSGENAAKAQQMDNLMAKAAQVQSQTDFVNREISRIVDVALAEVRTAVADEKARLAEMRTELARYEGRSETVGGDVLANNFGEVSKKFYDVLIRADVGTVDVAWAHKEHAETLFKRLTLEQSRERRVLEEQFGDVSREPPPGAFTPVDNQGEQSP